MDSRNKRSDKNSELYRAITALDSLDDCYDFLVDLCTQPELKAMEQRMEVAMLLEEGLIYSDILEKTPGGLAAVIGAKGVYLSGGEMQRIALARAILKDAPIVVLDEASSFADPENEAKIQKAFEALMKGKTVLMIAHRLSTVRNMDRILVIRDGGIAEEGKHDELLEKGGVYAAMWEEYQKAAQWKVGGAA